VHIVPVGGLVIDVGLFTPAATGRARATTPHSDDTDGARPDRPVFSLRSSVRSGAAKLFTRHHGRVRPEAKALGTSAESARRVGSAELAVASVGDTTITREVMAPGWRWSTDVKPVVGTDLCRALHQLFVVSGRLHFVMEDGGELSVGPGDAAVVPPGHDAWVVGEEPCEIVDFSPAYSQLIAAGEAYQAVTAAGASRPRRSRARAAQELRAEARAGRLDAAAVELVLGAVGFRPRRQRGPAGLTARELQVLVLIATGASAKQVAHVLGIAPKTAATHIERIYVKCDVSTRSGATHFAIAHGLVNPLMPAER
jgi:DNA-binding CsgD family transcriptional regulator/mannose-6-phosphate isomerase-like protein (cupin superfamily)